MEARKPACSWIDSPRRHTRSRASEMGRVDLPIMVVLFVQQQHEALARHNTAPNDLVSPMHLAEPLSAQANAIPEAARPLLTELQQGLWASAAPGWTGKTWL